MDNRNNQLVPRQQDLELFPVKEVEVDGVQMGVMNDGTPFLTGRSLAVMCGVHHSVIQDLSTGWSSERLKPRGKKIDAIIREQGFEASNLYIPSTTSRRDHYHYPDYDCILSELAESQASYVRHKDAFSAYLMGYDGGLKLTNVA